MVQVAVGRRLPAVGGVDVAADGQAPDEGVAHLDQQRVQPPHDGVRGVLAGVGHDQECAGRG